MENNLSIKWKRTKHIICGIRARRKVNFLFSRCKVLENCADYLKKKKKVYITVVSHRISTYTLQGSIGILQVNVKTNMWVHRCVGGLIIATVISILIKYAFSSKVQMLLDCKNTFLLSESLGFQFGKYPYLEMFNFKLVVLKLMSNWVLTLLWWQV